MKPPFGAGAKGSAGRSSSPSERFDGSGYPAGLKGKEIPLAARIFAVVDVWDALLSETCFRKRWSPEKVLDHLRRASGVQFDPEVVSAFASLLEEDPSLSERPF
jgi:HD-GYP domain-containing protein (c-di-GMP phosphodiesterase class II)